MAQWLEQRDQLINLTQPMNAVGSSSRSTRGYEFDSLKLKSEFIFTRLL